MERDRRRENPGAHLIAGVALLLLAGCPRRSEPPSGGSAVTATASRAPDLGLIELCPPKPPPPGAVSREEMARREREQMERRLADYERQTAERQRAAQQARQVAGARCDALVAAIRAGRPDADDAPSAPDPARSLAGRLTGPIDELATCLAFASASDAPCAASAVTQSDCVFRRAVFRRGSDPTALETIAEVGFALCQKGQPAAACRAVRDAIRSGSPKRCPRAAALGPMCAQLASPPSQCPAGKAGPRCDQPETWISALGAGRFAGVWPSDPAADTLLAAAASTGKPESCAPLAEKLQAACVALAMPMLPAEPRRPENVPGAVPSVPQQEGATVDGGTALPGTPPPPPPSGPGPLGAPR